MTNKNLWTTTQFLLVLWVAGFLTLLSCSSLSAQNISNRGSEFWAVFPTHVPDIDKQFNVLNANFSIFITSPQFSSGTVSVGSFSQHFSVAANGITEIAIPRNIAYINDTEAGNVLTGRAIHVLVDPGMPDIVVYAHIFAGQRSAASLILPKGSLGQQYYSMNFPEYDSEGQNFIVIAASEPDTRVRIKRGNTDLVPGGVLLKQVNDVYEFLSNDDLTGVSVSVDSLTSSCKHFAAFSGSSGVYILSPGCTPRSIDPLFQQCYPLSDWGTAYGFVPFSTQSAQFNHPVRTAGQLLRVVASKKATAVKIDGKTVATLDPGGFYTTPAPLNQPASITASAPVAVAQYALTQSCNNTGVYAGSDTSGYSDPDMVLLNPLAYGINNITAYSSTRENITEQYINVIINTTAAGSFLINGKTIADKFKTSAALPGLSYAQLNVSGDSTKVFHLQADSNFNAVAYGFGNVESYSYSAGTNLSGSGNIKAIRTVGGETIDSACVEDNYYFSLTLPYKARSISWKMDTGEDPVMQDQPIYDSVAIAGIPYYIYKLKKTPAYSVPGKHLIKINVVYTLTIGGCADSQVEIDGTFTVIPPPSAKFTTTVDACLFNRISFAGVNNSPNQQVSSWYYDFGDVFFSNGSENVTHTYQKNGNYLATLTVTSKDGCQSAFEDTVHITRNVIPGFSVTTPDCAGHAVSFSDTSITSGFNTSLRKWDFGDGDSLITHNQMVSHTYLLPGKYNATLILTSDKGCIDSITSEITIASLPQPDFLMPGLCVSDIGQFKDITANENGKLSYRWQFGDFANSTDGGTSNLQNPQYHYTAAGAYSVSLTITDEEGCENTTTKTLLVNGSAIKADFNILNSQTICQGQNLILQDLSKVDFGRAIKREWVISDDQQVITRLTDTTTSDLPVTIPLISLPPLNKVNTLYIKLLSYSGTMCVDSVIKPVTVFPMPKLSFDAINAVCLSAPAFQIVQAQEQTGVPGEGVYKGPGISAQGLFTPGTAGIGEHLITYIFTSAAGCTDSVSTLLEVKSDAGVTSHTYTVQQGDRIKLMPVYSGKLLSYRWSPSTWLDTDTAQFPFAAPQDSITYTVTVSNGTCTATGQVHIKVLRTPVIYSSFTPNGDGVNDLWDIPYLKDYPMATVDIFNRYGALVYHSIGYNQPWNGTYHNKPVPNGTYYYIINDGKQVFSGYVAVLR